MANVTIDDLVPLISDPARVQQLILSNIDNFEIVDPTNPCIMLLEATTAVASAAAVESTTSLRRIYPSLATTVEDVLPHVTDAELTNIFSYPASTSIAMYISVIELRSNGNRVDAGGYVETIIPIGTVISVAAIPFTLLNDIHIKLYDTGVVFAEQLTSPEASADNSIGILPAGITNFQDGSPWVTLETTLKQLNKSVINKAITTAEGFKLRVKHTDKYHFSNVYFRDAATNGNWVRLSVTHSDTYINPAVPTVSVIVMDQLVEYTIPDVYLISGQVSGEIMIELYETQGYLDIPINKYQMSEFNVKVNSISPDPVKATIANITVYANSRDVVSGGKSGYTFEELRNSVIHNTLGHEVLPVTSEQLARAAKLQGFELHNLIDIVTNRVYAATRSTSRHASSLAYTRADIFFNTVSVDLTTINNSKVIIGDTYAMIPSNTVFRETNGIITVVNDMELATISALGTTELIRYVRNNQLFFTPYYYIIDTASTSAINTRVYDLDSPSLLDIKITGKNVNVLERVNVGKYGLIRTDTGYDLIITVLSNTEFSNTNRGLLKGQLGVPIHNGQSTIYFEGLYSPTTEMMTFKIDTNFNLTINDTLEITNGISDVSNKFTDLVSLATIHLYSIDASIQDNTDYLVDQIVLPDTDITVFDREEITITFGAPVKHIWNKLFTTYTARKYLTHTYSKPMVYADDVYDIDPTTGSIVTVVPDGAGGLTTSTTKLHTKGDPVLDANGNVVYEFTSGSVVLDADGLPTVDVIAGVIRHVDILMLEYEYMVANSLVAKNYLTSVKETLNGWMFTSLPALNTKVIENTSVLYRSYKKAESVEITVESLRTRIPYDVRPTVTLYTTRNDYSGAETTNLMTEIGFLIHDALDNQNVSLSVLKTAIIDTVDVSIVSVRLDGIESFRNSEMFSMVDPITRLTLGKVLTTNNNNELVVNYDIDLKIHKI